MHDMYIFPVGYINNLSIEQYNNQVCYCRWFEMHQFYVFNLVLFCPSHAIQEKLIFNLHLV